MFPVAIYGLLYGDYPELHRRLVDSLLRHARNPAIRVTLWCNQVCKETLTYLRETPYRIHNSTENVPKYQAMRKMFSEDIPEPWIVWFDDDSYIVEEDWLSHMQNYIEENRIMNISYIGARYFVPFLPGQWEFICQSKWFRGKRPYLIKGKTPGFVCAQGSNWWLRTDVLRYLDWPDERLSHNGGDTLLGEAVRQNNFLFHAYSYGVKINEAERRGYHEAPAGCTRPQVRI